MEFQSCFPIWDQLDTEQQARILGSLVSHRVKKGTVIHNGSMDCTGLLLIKSGQLRVYILSDEGREITLYRLFELDMCLFSASCMLRSIQFDVTIAAEKDAEFWVVPTEVYKSILEESAQIMWKSLDRRLAAFLLEEASIEGTDRLKITHETIANHLGSHREVITRMLRYFQNEGMVRLSRGVIEITDADKLEETIGH